MARTPQPRRAHWLPHNLTNAQPSQLVFVDTETHPISVPGSKTTKLHQLRLWCATRLVLRGNKVTRRQEATGTTTEAFWDWLLPWMQEKKPTWLFAHNAGFDLTVLHFWHLIERGILQLEQAGGELPLLRTGKQREDWRGMLVTEGPPTIIEVRKRRGLHKLLCLDTLNYWRCSLRDLGESVGLLKGKLPPWDAPDHVWEAYCRRDVEIIEKAVVELMGFVRREDLGVFRYTAPSQAFSAYRHRFMDAEILIHDDKEALKAERESYYGGECRAFFVGDVVEGGSWLERAAARPQVAGRAVAAGPVHTFDVNGFYPSVMAANRFPRRLKGTAVMPGEKHLETWLERFCLVARVQLDSPIIPFPVRRDGKTFMATGRFATTLTTPEIQLCVREGVKLKIGYVAYYEADELFPAWVDYCYSLRERYKEQGNRVMAEFSKLLANALFGKFGQLEGRWLDRPDISAPDLWGTFCDLDPHTRTTKAFRSVVWKVQEKAGKNESRHSFPAIPAHVTALGRLRVRELRQLAGEGEVFYQDTDSLHVTELGAQRLVQAGQVDPAELGKLKSTGVYTTAEYRGLKYYRLGERWVIAGVKGDAEEVTRGVWRQLEFAGLDSMLTKAAPIGVPVREVTIDRSTEVIPGELRPDGRVVPLTLSEW